MSDKTIQQRVTEIVQEQLYDKTYPGEVIRPEIKSTDLLANHGADSIDLMELGWEIEDRFSIEIPEGESAGFHTVDNIVRYLEERGCK